MKNLLTLVLLSTLFLPGAAHADPKATLARLKSLAVKKKLAFDPMWLKLGHYKKGFLGGYNSPAGGKFFFLSAEGSGDPQAELLATLDGFFAPQSGPEADENPDQMHPICRFPARFHWLKRELGTGEGDFPGIHCKRYDEFIKRVSAHAISVVFSSYYMSSSSSVFGHTFLRIHKSLNSARSNGNELLDYGINYGADATTSNPVFYALFGIIGVFHGTFSNIPYYYKIREYNDFESRDLWGYELNLTQEQVNRVVDHLWEMGSTYFHYYFFTENCSYQLLEVLEVADPSLELVADLPYWVIPSDTLRVLSGRKNLLRTVDFRPSVRTQFEARLTDLSADQTEKLSRLLKSRDLSEAMAIPDVRAKGAVLDAAMDGIDFQHPEILKNDKGDGSPEFKFKQKVLSARASLGFRSSDVTIAPPESQRPDLGHGTARFGLGGGSDTIDHGFMRAQMRFALHDALDYPQGYPKLAQVEFMNVKGRYAPSSGKIRLQEIGLLRTQTILPGRWYDHGSTNSLATGLYEIRDQDCDHCLAGRVDGGMGRSFELAGATFFGLLEAELTYSSSFTRSHARIGAGPRTGVFIPFSDRFRWIAQAELRALAFSEYPSTYYFETGARWTFSPKWAVDGFATGFADHSREAAVNFYFYF